MWSGRQQKKSYFRTVALFVLVKLVVGHIDELPQIQKEVLFTQRDRKRLFKKKKTNKPSNQPYPNIVT